MGILSRMGNSTWDVLRGRFRPRRDARCWARFGVAARTCWWDLWKPPTPMCIMPLLHAARSTIGGGLKVTLGRSGTVPSGEAILRISARTTKRVSLPLLVCGVARTRDARRSASGAASAVLKPIIAATCAAMFLMFDRPFRQPRFDTTAATKESDEPSRPLSLALRTSPLSHVFWAFSDGFAFHGL